MNLPHTILLAGLGNTGSHLAPLIARAGGGGLLVLADPDIVEAGNTGAQSYGPDDVGKTKAEAMAERLAGINPRLQIECLVGELEVLPLGYFGDLVVLCLDHDGARQVAAERAWWMGGTLFDVAVNGQAGLARVSRFVRGLGKACLECAWSPEQYGKLPVRNSCRRILPTRAPAALGSFAASLAATRLFSPASDDFNTEIVSSPGAGEMWATNLMENGHCRFNHRSPTVECLNHFDLSCGFGQLLDNLQTDSIEAPGFTFATRARCTGCGTEEDVLLLNRNDNLTCSQCDWAIETLPFHSRAVIQREDITAGHAMLSLTDMGFRPGDVVRTDINRWFQLGCIRNSSSTFPNHHHE
jgi:molybdopterin/thiamine biosynthesis adenylyltransferase